MTDTATSAAVANNAVPTTNTDNHRDKDECMVILETSDANNICAEVDAGEHQTFDDALHYIITRGLAEISRTRIASAKLAQQKAAGKAQEAFSKVLAANPLLVTQPDALVATMKALGITLPPQVADALAKRSK